MKRATFITLLLGITLLQGCGVLFESPEDKAARQERETGYCEAIIIDKTKNSLLESLTIIESSIPETIEQQFFDTARKMIIKNE